MREILLVEDNLGDICLTEMCLRKAPMPTHLNVVEDGVEAMAFLRQGGPYRFSPLPDLILMDLNLPRQDGREVLAEIRSDTRLRHIPVIILSLSDSERDIHEMYDLQANCYIIKPVMFGEFEKIIRSVVMFWANAVPMSLMDYAPSV